MSREQANEMIEKELEKIAKEVLGLESFDGNEKIREALEAVFYEGRAYGAAGW